MSHCFLPYTENGCMRSGWLGSHLTTRTLQVPADEVVEVKHKPKIDFTYSGQQKLDLGFGAFGGSPAQPDQALSWERLRQVYFPNIWQHPEKCPDTSCRLFILGLG